MHILHILHTLPTTVSPAAGFTKKPLDCISVAEICVSGMNSHIPGIR
ncbi:hypothetical protein GJA_3865 [Janthinobacterium agaricidamnosum NBRC 102515 = DSM 9628]|uniref:Uncharacterized protein n=1 Tax=Janthinobacterium agaricidamnosum NBRC 102515 = DSM 9628 TaxID=1349767 RepID=W0V9D2_9BURK|nr:hypothetical protein GJA_3865 [Janthinobacterium agaricidamnosum NBRC 102515 = DSM 9628]